MSVFSRVSAFAIAPLLGGVCKAAGLAVVGEGVSVASRFFVERLSDQSLRVADALKDSADEAWRTIELALAGESLLSTADRSDDKAFREQVRLFIVNARAEGRIAPGQRFVDRCLIELRAAKAAGVLDADNTEAARLADGLGDLTRFADPMALLEAQWKWADELSGELSREGYPALASLIALRCGDELAAAPLLAVAMRHCFRRALQADPRLFQGLAFAHLERIANNQQQATDQLAALLSRYVGQLEVRLGELRKTTEATRAEVRDLGTRLHAPAPAALPNPSLPKPIRPQALVESHSLAIQPEVREEPVPSRTETVLRQSETVLRAHTGAVACVAVLPDGQRAVTGGADRGLWVWDLKRQREIKCIPGHRDRICCLAFAPEGQRVLSSSLDQSVRLWDIDTGLEIKCLDRQTNRSAAFAHDGRSVLCGGLRDGRLRLLDVASGREIRSFAGHDDWVVCVAFASDGKVALSGGLDRSIKLWDVASGQLLREFALPACVQSSVAFSPDGWRVLSGGADRIVRVWDTFTGQELCRLLGHTDAVSCIAMAPEGDRAASAGHDGTVRVWDLRLKRQLQCFEGHVGNVLCVAFTPDGDRLISGGEDGTVRVWELAPV